MSSKDTSAGVRRPPAVSLTGSGAPPPGVSRPIRLSTTTPRTRGATPAKAKKSISGAPEAAKKTASTTTTAQPSPAPKRRTSMLGSGRAKTPSRTPPVALSNVAAPAGPTTTTTTTTMTTTAATTAAATMAATASAARSAARHTHPTATGAVVAVPPLTVTSLSSMPSSTAGVPARVGSTSSPSLAVSYAPTSLAAGAAPTTVSTSVAAATSAIAGERYEPTSYKLGFAVRGGYTCLEAVPASATLWLGKRSTGALEVYSSTTGKLIVTLPPREGSASQRARADAVSDVVGHRPQDMIFAGVAAAGDSVSVRGGSPCEDPLGGEGGAARGTADAAQPTALRASRTHMWVGYADGNVAVYDHLVLTFITEGRFHTGPVKAFAMLDDGTVVSAGEDGTLVHWDTEEGSFEAMVSLPRPTPTLSDDGALTCLLALPRSGAVLCGFQSGSVYAVDVYDAARRLRPAGSRRSSSYARGAEEGCRGTLLALHEGRVNALAGLGDLLFSAAEDGTVCVSRLFLSTAPTDDSGRADSSGQSARVATWSVATSAGQASRAQSPRVTWRLLKRLHVQPCVRGLLVDKTTRSVYVAYRDGLIERWSGHPDDDFGVEEVIREGMRADEHARAGDAEESAHTGAGHREKSRASAVGKRSSASSAAPRAALGNQEVTGLVAINAVETLQVLALSSNGVNKVWYGHRNTLEENISSSINALNAVIAEDAHDTAVWRERLGLLKAKEEERRGKYVHILEQLSEQRLMLTFYEKWRRRVVGMATGRSKFTVVCELEQRCEHRLRLRYFGRWAAFYDMQQTLIRRHTLAEALARATRNTYLVTLFHRWQTRIATRRILSSVESCVSVLARAAAARLLGPIFLGWMHHARNRAGRRSAIADLQLGHGLVESRMQLLERKAQQQTLRRALGHWLAAVEERQRHTAKDRVWRHYVDVYAQLQDARLAKSLFQGWRRLAQRRRRRTALAAVAELRARQCGYHLQQRAYLVWVQFLHQRHLAAHAERIRAVEERLKAAETEAGGDIFEKLQLQRRIDQLIEQQERETELLRRDQGRLRALQDTRDAALEERAQAEQQLQEHLRGSADDGGALVAVSAETIAALPTVADGSLSTMERGSTVAAAAARAKAATGPITQHANYFRHLVEQQRLAPAVLSLMPLPDAVGHVMAQLKGSVLNLYTDMGLFRQVKDRRRAGATPAAILLESFGEVKRLMVSSVRRGPRRGSGPRAMRWPLSLEALDSIPGHQCAGTLSAVKTMVVSYDLLSTEDAEGITATCEEIVANADWIFLIARACYMRRTPLLPVNNRV